MRLLSNSEIISRLTHIRGIGRWTVEMLLIFKLGRADVMAADDYGLRKGLAAIRGQKELPTPAELARQGLAWKPYRSIASWYLWRAAENYKIV
jgi:3-methyladenine DNA glycosylase/8-oxoguanine DNA glycosylase